jgi:hypothetical protein
MSSPSRLARAGRSPALALCVVAASLAGGLGADSAAAEAGFVQGQGGKGLFGGRGAGARARGMTAPPVGKYVAGDDQAFVLDRSGQAPLLKFEDSAEVWVLRPAPGPRGDVIYKDDTGREVVRASRLGGLTLFTADRPSGLPAALAGQAVSIRPQAISPSALYEHYKAQSRRVYRATRLKLAFETVQDATPATAALFADAATVAGEALARDQRGRGAGVLKRLRTVRFALGPRPSAAVAGDALTVTISPGQGVGGRPSSERIARALAVAE